MNDSERNDPESSTRLDPAEAALLLIAGRISAPVEPEPAEVPEPEAGERAAPPETEPAEDAADAAPIEPVPADPVSAEPLEAPLAGAAGVEQEPVEVEAYVPDPVADPAPAVEPLPDPVESVDAEPVEAALVDEPVEDWPPEPPIMAARREPAVAPERIAAGNPPPPVPEIDGERLAIPPPAGMNRIIVVIAALSILFGLGAIMTSAWVYSEAQRDLRQLATDVAQLRVGLELFARQQTAAPDVGEVYARLMEVEQSVREALASAPQGAGTGAGTTPALPSIGLGPSAQSDGDCLPLGTRFLVTTGDRYPVCGTQGVVEILSVGALDIALGDGSAVAIGGSTTLANTSCTLSVLTANEDGMSGYGEIRVNC